MSETPTSKSDVYAPVPPELQAEIERYQSRLYNITEDYQLKRVKRPAKRRTSRSIKHQASSTVAREIQTTYHGVSALVHNEALAEIRKLREGLRQAEAREDALKADNEALKAENETLTTELCESEEACQALDIRWTTLENERRMAARRQGPSRAQTELEGANKTLLDKLSKYQTALDQSNNSVETLLDEADKQSDRFAELKKIIEQYKAMVE
ncbi:hypothetical protein HBH56_045540 [Parastagonospora nodorum]|uniref:Uncharacterized protein n=1 Tax=Phaeosphaeria nodorum (strain SN15 / ATCC MYA-4574 / FGSC 10173) TaxID=321614 RepID=A0A7U2ETB0_PHANO|nr:hypothetical protein HBH56_045540 [Parastagonospora nodorum]QRC92681.1 hypothetical protein JI435_082630 [Parastagonospora nodorum SN15]KAH3933084.1 hypothetical protein HBH54_073290 [Parastagonospora nodorum]KAH4139537.1 hypothetical protein HBH45_090390 [Parastagonospora nodorum]KAH4168922.1 hypothetical protein HBH44_046210 [Parastagonospora nodorum]